MARTKSRRAVNIDSGYIVALKAAAADRFKGEKTGTGIATLILVGDTEPLAGVVRLEAAQGVSMSEAIWLALRQRAATEGVKMGVLVGRILDGSARPLTQTERELGEGAANVREGQREAERPRPVVDATAPSSVSPLPPLRPFTETERELGEVAVPAVIPSSVVDAAAPSSAPSRHQSTSLDKMVEPDQEYYGGVFSI